MWDVIDLSRWQFALTALYHFLFVPLTLGLIFLLAIMETIYVVTGKTIYRASGVSSSVSILLLAWLPA